MVTKLVEASGRARDRDPNFGQNLTNRGKEGKLVDGVRGTRAGLSSCTRTAEGEADESKNNEDSGRGPSNGEESRYRICRTDS
jgi:hypothetical protein